MNGPSRENVLITGGAGFIGCNLAESYLQMGSRVTLLDNLSRSGVRSNVEFLQQSFGSRVTFVEASVSDRSALREAVSKATRVFHLAAQVAVTTSLTDPALDYQTNLAGTFHLLEELRRLASPPPLLYTSTNKVYGNLDDVSLRVVGARYEPEEEAICANGVGEWRRLDFHTPYGCSKGAAEQYVLDYARSYGLQAAVFRMSCIYGPHQFGTEDQGWVAHFLIQAQRGRPIQIYGDGKQVRDILFASDLMSAFHQAMANMDRISGQAFNIGGGPSRSVSLLELLGYMAEFIGQPPEVEFQPWRRGDQRYYVSDTRGFRHATGWRPGVGVREGLLKLNHWLTGGGLTGAHRALVGRSA